MSGPLETRLDREEGRRSAAAAEQDSAAIRRRHIWRAEAAIGAVIRSALARAGVDAAQATSLCLADEADAALMALSNTPELQRADGDGAAAQDGVQGDVLKSRILALARAFVGGPPPDFAKASFAELFAWSLAQPPAE